MRLSPVVALACLLIPTGGQAADQPGSPAPTATPSAVADTDPYVVADQVSGVYHVPGCPLIGEKSGTFRRSVTQWNFAACPKCNPGRTVPGEEIVSKATPSPTPSSDTYSTGSSSGGDVEVKGYRKKDGTYVKPHTRKKPKPKT